MHDHVLEAFQLLRVQARPFCASVKRDGGSLTSGGGSEGRESDIRQVRSRLAGLHASLVEDIGTEKPMAISVFTENAHYSQRSKMYQTSPARTTVGKMAGSANHGGASKIERGHYAATYRKHRGAQWWGKRRKELARMIMQWGKPWIGGLILRSFGIILD